MICIFEDIDAIIQNYGDCVLLQWLDGHHQVDRVINLATTNYPERRPQPNPNDVTPSAIVPRMFGATRSPSIGPVNRRRGSMPITRKSRASRPIQMVAVPAMSSFSFGLCHGQRLPILPPGSYPHSDHAVKHRLP